MTDSSWSTQGETFSVEHRGLVWHFRKLRNSSHPPVELSVIESARDSWSVGVTGDRIGYADIPEAIRQELKAEQCVVSCA